MGAVRPPSSGAMTGGRACSCQAATEQNAQRSSRGTGNFVITLYGAVLMPCEFYRKTRTYRQVFGIMDAALNGDSRPCSQRNYWYHSHYCCGTISQIISGANPTTRSSHDPLVRANSRSHIGYSTETISPYNIAREPRFITVHLMALKAYGLERDSRSPGRRVTQVSLDPRRRHTSWRPGTSRIYSNVATSWAATA